MDDEYIISKRKEERERIMNIEVKKIGRWNNEVKK